MSFTFRPAKRESIGFLLGLAGGTGSGKTYSALRLATGLAGDRPFALIDTEAGRAKHYADEFKFDHGDMLPPFRPEAYADAIRVADEAGYPVIVVDSASHEHAGEGGLLDWHEEELTRLAGDDWKRREAMKMAAWVKPKMAHKAMVQRLLQVRAHLILCLRAEEKIEMVRGEDGKMQVIPKRTLTGLAGWVPVCEKTLPYELTISCLLTADAPGVPRPIKLPAQLRALVPPDRPLDETVGRALAEWAAGKSSESPTPEAAKQEIEMAEEHGVTQLLELAAQIGPEAHESAVSAIVKHRKAHDGGVTSEWLERQVAALLKRGARLPEEEPLFRAPIPKEER